MYLVVLVQLVNFKGKTMFKFISKLKPYLGIVAILYPALQNLLALKGIVLPDLGDLGEFASITTGTALVAKSEKI